MVDSIIRRGEFASAVYGPGRVLPARLSGRGPLTSGEGYCGGAGTLEGMNVFR